MEDDAFNPTRHPCRCGAMATLVHTVCRVGPMPEIRGYKCTGCGAGFAVEVTAAAFPSFARTTERVHYGA